MVPVSQEQTQTAFLSLLWGNSVILWEYLKINLEVMLTSLYD